MAMRGTQFNIPLDVRTPSYTDVCDAAQNNLPEMWSFAFWKESIETHNFVAPEETHITLSIYGAGTVALVKLETGEISRVSAIPNHHNEPEGIYPDGKHTLVESSRQFTGDKLRNPVQHIDIWKLSLDGKERWERITHFTDYKGYKSSNPVVSDDGRYIAFQMARLGDPAGVGRGLFLLDIETMQATQK